MYVDTKSLRDDSYFCYVCTQEFKRVIHTQWCVVCLYEECVWLSKVFSWTFACSVAAPHSSPMRDMMSHDLCLTELIVYCTDGGTADKFTGYLGLLAPLLLEPVSCAVSVLLHYQAARNGTCSSSYQPVGSAHNKRLRHTKSR